MHMSSSDLVTSKLTLKPHWISMIFLWKIHIEGQKEKWFVFPLLNSLSLSLSSQKSMILVPTKLQNLPDIFDKEKSNILLGRKPYDHLDDVQSEK